MVSGASERTWNELANQLHARHCMKRATTIRDARRCQADTSDVSSHDSHDLNEGSDERSIPAGRRRLLPFVVVTSHELNDAAVGLRIFDCFSPQRPTLMTGEISEIVHAQPQDVIRHAERLVRNGYLRADSSSGASAWTLIADER
jgi:hypothetical protein